MKAIALTLLVTFPSMGWAQVVNSPAFPQSDAPVATSLVPRDLPQTLEVTPAPLYQRWYFWTGIGVVVAGLIVTAVLMSMKKPASPSAAEICGPRGCDSCVGFNCTN